MKSDLKKKKLYVFREAPAHRWEVPNDKRAGGLCFRINNIM